MRLFHLLFITCTTLSYAASSLDSYFDYLNRYPEVLGPTGNANQGEIEIIR